MARPQNDSHVNGKAQELPDGWNQWPGINQVARILGTNHSAVTRLVASGAITRIVGPDGTPRYNPDDVTASVGLFETEPPKAGLTPEDFKAGNELVKLVHTHHAAMVPLLVDGYRSMLEVAKEQLSSIRAELRAKDEMIAALLKQRDEAAVDREKLVSEEYTRAMQQRAFESSERRKDRAVSAVTDKLAPLLMQKLGAGDPRLQLGLEFLKTVKRDQLMGLLAIGVLEPNQAAIVRKLCEPLTKEESDALDPPPATVSNEAPTVPPAPAG